MSRLAVGAIALLLAVAAAPSHARDGAATEDAIERLTDGVVTMLPLGRIFDSVAATNPAWPAKEGGKVDAQQLACLRSELSSEGYRRSKRADVVAYVQRNPSRVAGDVELLAKAAPLFGRLVMAGAESSTTTAEDVLASASGEEMLAMVKVISDPSTSELRKLAGMGDAIGIDKSETENEATGKQLGASLAAQAIIQATITCKVPPGAFL